MSVTNIVMIRRDIFAVAHNFRFATGPYGSAAIGLSLMSNLSATSLVAYKAWCAAIPYP